MRQVVEEILQTDAQIRYIAIYKDGQLDTALKPGLANASASQSDKYEELLVNPTVLKLVTQRGAIDCGGAQFVVIRYGNFFQWVRPIKGGHVSV